jgi:hypothetical protein
MSVIINYLQVRLEHIIERVAFDIRCCKYGALLLLSTTYL